MNPTVLFVVLISFRKDTSEEIRQDIFDRYQTLAKNCGGEETGIISWAVNKNLDLRKGVHLVEIASFRDLDALQAFRSHPKHIEFTDVLRTIADWQVGCVMG